MSTTDRAAFEQYAQTKPLHQPAPQPNILNPAFKYTNSADTDVTRTWEKYGWKPTWRTP